MSKYVEYLYTYNLWFQTMLNGSSCIPALLLSVLHSPLQMDKHSSSNDCSCQNILSNYLNWKLAGSWIVVTSSCQFLRVTLDCNYWLAEPAWSPRRGWVNKLLLQCQTWSLVYTTQNRDEYQDWNHWTELVKYFLFAHFLLRRCQGDLPQKTEKWELEI